MGVVGFGVVGFGVVGFGAVGFGVVGFGVVGFGVVDFGVVGFGVDCGGTRGGGGSVAVPLLARSTRGRAAASPLGGGVCRPLRRVEGALLERTTGRRPSPGDAKSGCWTGSGRPDKGLQKSSGEHDEKAGMGGLLG